MTYLQGPSNKDHMSDDLAQLHTDSPGDLTSYRLSKYDKCYVNPQDLQMGCQSTSFDTDPATGTGLCQSYEPSTDTTTGENAANYLGCATGLAEVATSTHEDPPNLPNNVGFVPWFDPRSGILANRVDWSLDWNIQVERPPKMQGLDVTASDEIAIPDPMELSSCFEDPSLASLQTNRSQHATRIADRSLMDFTFHSDLVFERSNVNMASPPRQPSRYDSTTPQSVTTQNVTMQARTIQAQTPSSYGPGLYPALCCR